MMTQARSDSVFPLTSALFEPLKHLFQEVLLLLSMYRLQTGAVITHLPKVIIVRAKQPPLSCGSEMTHIVDNGHATSLKITHSCHSFCFKLLCQKCYHQGIISLGREKPQYTPIPVKCTKTHAEQNLSLSLLLIKKVNFQNHLFMCLNHSSFRVGGGSRTRGGEVSEGKAN